MSASAIGRKRNLEFFWKTCATNKKRPDPTNHGMLEQPSPRTAHTPKIRNPAEGCIPRLRDWMARTSHLPNLGLVVAWVTSRLVTKESHRFWKRSPKVFLSGRKISPTDSEPMVVPFRSRPRRLRY